jgi:hypothetical protein
MMRTKRLSIVHLCQPGNDPIPGQYFHYSAAIIAQGY